MGSRPGRRSFGPAIVKTLVAVGGVVGLAMLFGLVIASPQVRRSGLGKRLERCFPLRWSQVALLFGNEEERARAASVAARTGSRRAVPMLIRAADDRSAAVSSAAVCGLAAIVPAAPGEAERGILSASRHRRPAVRAAAYQALGAVPGHGGARLTSAAQAAVAAGLSDPDPGCQWEAFRVATKLLWVGEANPDLLRALQNRLCTPPSVPPPGSPWSSVWSGTRRLSVRQLEAALTRGSPIEQFGALEGLWLCNTPESRRALRHHLQQHPLTDPPRAGR